MGGWDNCVVTVGADTIPHPFHPGETLTMPDHGDAWLQKVATRVEGQTLATTWRGLQLPYEFTQKIGIDEAGDVRFDYQLRNTGDRAFPALWASHPLLPLDAQTRVHIPAGTPFTVDNDVKPALGLAFGPHAWPLATLKDGRVVDLSNPAALSQQLGGKTFACKLFFTLPESEQRPFGIQQGDQVLEMRFDAPVQRDFGMWINWGGWAPDDTADKRFHDADGHGYYNIGFYPALGGTSDKLSNAIARKENLVLEPNAAALEFSIRVSVRPAS